MAKSVFITGAAAGIGRVTALKFAAKGYTVGGYDVDEAGLASLRDEITKLGATAVTGHLDVTDHDQMVTRLDEFVAAAGGRWTCSSTTPASWWPGRSRSSQSRCSTG